MFRYLSLLTITGLLTVNMARSVDRHYKIKQALWAEIVVWVDILLKIKAIGSSVQQSKKGQTASLACWQCRGKTKWQYCVPKTQKQSCFDTQYLSIWSKINKLHHLLQQQVPPLLVSNESEPVIFPNRWTCNCSPFCGHKNTAIHSLRLSTILPNSNTFTVKADNNRAMWAELLLAVLVSSQEERSKKAAKRHV